MPDLGVISWICSFDIGDGMENHLFLSSIGVPGVDHGEDAGEHPRRSTHEQSGDVTEAKGAGEGGL